MIYRIYNEKQYNYELECQVKNIDELFEVLDILILDEEANKVLVTEDNESYEFPMYLYTGDKIEYITFKQATKDIKEMRI